MIRETDAVTLVLHGRVVVGLPAAVLALFLVGRRANQNNDVVLGTVVDRQIRERAVNKPAIPVSADGDADDVGGIR